LTTGHTFDRRTAFDTWWLTNRNARERLWYWGIRWRARRPEDELEALGGLEPAAGLKVLLLAASHYARDAEAQLSWLRAAPRGRIGTDHHQSSRPRSETVVRFVKRNSLERFLRGLLSGAHVWPEVRPRSQAAKDLFRDLMPVCTEVFTRADAALIERILSEGRGPAAGDPQRQEELVLLAVDLDPGRAEELLSSQLEREPRQPLVAVRLLNTSGLKHWRAVRRTFGSNVGCRGKCKVVRAVGALGGRGKDALSGLYSMSDISARGDGRGGQYNRQLLFRSFVAAAGAANGGRPIVDQSLLGRACFQYSKGTSEAMERHNRAVPVARQTALLKLNEFLER
ncbi:MAG: hypothetical protein ACYSU0_09450, partial [Planctomycetota bacterium]|jgi:hypothetical protein